MPLMKEEACQLAQCKRSPPHSFMRRAAFKRRRAGSKSRQKMLGIPRFLSLTSTFLHFSRSSQGSLSLFLSFFSPHSTLPRTPPTPSLLLFTTWKCKFPPRSFDPFLPSLPKKRGEREERDLTYKGKKNSGGGCIEERARKKKGSAKWLGSGLISQERKSKSSIPFLRPATDSNPNEVNKYLSKFSSERNDEGQKNLPLSHFPHSFRSLSPFPQKGGRKEEKRYPPPPPGIFFFPLLPACFHTFLLLLGEAGKSGYFMTSSWGSKLKGGNARRLRRRGRGDGS